MALTDIQVRQLKAKLEPRHVKSRKANGVDLQYVEGWHVIAEANRIFGYDAWYRRTLATHYVCGSGEASAPTPGQAHELALKGAETDATKRALATFGNPFGLALYDREQVGVRKKRGGRAALAIGPWVLR